MTTATYAYWRPLGGFLSFPRFGALDMCSPFRPEANAASSNTNRSRQVGTARPRPWKRLGWNLVFLEPVGDSHVRRDLGDVVLCELVIPYLYH